MVLAPVRRMFAIGIASELVFLDVLANRRLTAAIFHLIDLRVFAAAGTRCTFMMHFARLLLGLALTVALCGFCGRLSACCATRLTAFSARLGRQFAILREAAAFRRDAFASLASGLRREVGIL